MKAIFAGAVLSFALAVPCAAFGQANTSATRTGVKADLEQWQAAGYRVSGAETTYPAEVEAAERRLPIEAHDRLRVADTGSGVAVGVGVGDTSGYGPQTGGTTQSGTRDPHGPGGLYSGS